MNSRRVIHYTAEVVVSEDSYVVWVTKCSKQMRTMEYVTADISKVTCKQCLRKLHVNMEGEYGTAAS